MDLLGRFRAPLVALILVNTIGILGFMVIDDYPFLDAVYQTVFTLTTVGYQETHPISQPGRLFVVFLILGGVAVWTYFLGVTISVVINADLVGKIREAMMEQSVGGFSKHYIVAGYTEISRQVIRSFRRQGIRFVVVDNDNDRLAMAAEDGVREVLPLNPFLNDSYRRANFATAQGMVAAFQEDADNITAVVTGKIMEDESRREVLIITVANHQESREKLIKVGANVVILPHELTGQRISAMVLHPSNQDQSSFLDRVAFGEFLNLDIREVPIGKGCSLDGLRIRDSNIRKAIGAHILGIQRQGRKRIILMPDPDLHIHAGDQVLIMGTLAQLEHLQVFLNPGGEEGGAEAAPVA